MVAKQHGRSAARADAVGAQILASTLFGILGLALADPMVAMIKVALERSSRTRRGRGDERGDGMIRALRLLALVGRLSRADRAQPQGGRATSARAVDLLDGRAARRRQSSRATRRGSSRRWRSTARSLTQSLAIIDWLDATYPEPPLIPRDPLARAAGAGARAGDRGGHPPAQQSARAQAAGNAVRRRPGGARTTGIATGSPKASPRWRRWPATPARSSAATRPTSPTSAWCRRCTMRAASTCRWTPIRGWSRRMPRCARSAGASRRPHPDRVQAVTPRGADQRVEQRQIRRRRIRPRRRHGLRAAPRPARASGRAPRPAPPRRPRGDDRPERRPRSRSRAPRRSNSVATTGVPDRQRLAQHARHAFDNRRSAPPPPRARSPAADRRHGRAGCTRAATPSAGDLRASAARASPSPRITSGTCAVRDPRQRGDQPVPAFLRREPPDAEQETRRPAARARRAPGIGTRRRIGDHRDRRRARSASRAPPRPPSPGSSRRRVEEARMQPQPRR